MKHKPHLGFWQIWNMSFGFLGIQFGWALQMANMSAIYSFLVASLFTFRVRLCADSVPGED